MISAESASPPVPAPKGGREKPPVAVIGGGYSGTMAAIQLARVLPGDQPILLCERGQTFGPGVAYSTPVPGHLLNVRAANMSAFASEPTHFEDWLEAAGDEIRAETHWTESGLFASRATYGKYLKSILQEALRRGRHPGQLRLLPDEIVDCVRCENGFELVTGGGRRYLACGVVLATGHVPPAPSPDRRYVTDPWAPSATRGLDDDRPVLVLGTGLTMVDIVASLRQTGFAGPIVAMSRRGALSQPHRPTAPWPMPSFTQAELGSVRQLMRRLRTEAAAAGEQGIDWRAVVDSIRPITAAIWSGWPEAERLRFLRHARRWWDIHRHRMAPPNARAIEAALADGSLRVVAGRIRGMTFEPEAIRVAYEPLGGGRVELAVQRVISATGLESAVRTRDKLMERLIDNGLVRFDGLGFGIEVTDDLQVVGADRRPIPRLWALGPIVRGMFWECIAVPDIRHQAERFGKLAVDALSTGREPAYEPEWVI
jgi:uncharacterized NAD(P)/FAD-binding protein YdhS